MEPNLGPFEKKNSVGCGLKLRFELHRFSRNCGEKKQEMMRCFDFHPVFLLIF